MRLGAAQTASKRLAFSRIQNGMLKFEKYDIDKSTITPLQSNTIHICSWDPLLYFSKWHQISHLKLNHWRCGGNATGGGTDFQQRLAFSRVQKGMLKFEKYDINKSIITPLQSNTMQN